MKRTAFTMVELVFVIVILGILAAVAIPKLSATRDDAEIVSLANKVTGASFDIAAYATAKGVINDDMKIMSPTLEDLGRSNDAVLTDRKAVIKAGDVSNCISIDVNASGGLETLYITFGNHNNDKICEPLQNKINIQEYPMKLKGNTVTY